jgi:thiamine-phosphate pyrophosphorylase
MRKIDWKLCLVADADMVRGLDLLEVIVRSVEAGVTVVQLRAKNLPTKAFLDMSLAVSTKVGKRGVPLIINDRVDVALAGKASGVHLGQEDMPLFYARALLGHSRLIGISVSTVKEAHRAEQEGADYIGVGPVFPTTTKDCGRPPLGLEGLRKIRRAVGIPILAIGGVNAANAGETMAAGADGLAVISAIMKAPDVGLAVTELLAALKAKK